MNNDHDGGSTWFLGLVLFGFFVWMLSKITTVVFIEVGKMFAAIGNAATSFFGMAWAITQLAGIVGLCVLLIYAVYQFILLVKNSTAIMEQFERRAEEFFARLQSEHDKTERSLNRMVYQMREELEEALKEPEAAPPEQVPTEATTASPAPQAAQTALPAPQESKMEQQPIATNEQSVSVSNPY